MPPADPLIVNPITIMVAGLPVSASNPLPVTGGSGTGLATLGSNAFTGNQTPATNDGAALGTAALSWSDLFLASGGVINWNNGNFTITHSAGLLTFSGAVTFSTTILVTGVATFAGNVVAPMVIALPTSGDARISAVATTSADAAYFDSTFPGVSGWFWGSNGSPSTYRWRLGFAASFAAAFSAFCIDVDQATKNVALGGALSVVGAVTATPGFITNAPNTQIGATYTVLVTDNYIIANRAGTVTLTLGTATAGRVLIIKTIQAQTVVSASSNVIPRAGGAAGTAILSATAGQWATLVGNGTNWEIMAGS